MKTRYGLRLMIELAAQDGHGPVLLKTIARAQGISQKFLSQIVIDLKASGLVTSTRGAHGGYNLARSAKEITACDIVSALEGYLVLVECTRNPNHCPRESQCVSQEVWQKLGQAMTDTLQQIHLDELVEQLREKNKDTVLYDI